MKRVLKESIKNIIQNLERCQDHLETITREKLDDDVLYNIELAIDSVGDAISELESILDDEEE